MVLKGTSSSSKKVNAAKRLLLLAVLLWNASHFVLMGDQANYFKNDLSLSDADTNHFPFMNKVFFSNM